MTVNKIVLIECDYRGRAGETLRLTRCKATWEGIVAEPRDVVLAHATREGWTREGGYDYCPTHSAMGKKP